MMAGGVIMAREVLVEAAVVGEMIALVIGLTSSPP
jgi:hypothetical protein